MQVGETIRIYLINIVEFDLINSFHLHAGFFDYYDTGTTLQPTLRMVDTIMQAQGQRGILEFKFRWPGKYMFHAHVSEFAELGWMGLFNAVEPAKYADALAEAGLDAEWDQERHTGQHCERSRICTMSTTTSLVFNKPKPMTSAAWAPRARATDLVRTGAVVPRGDRRWTRRTRWPAG